MSLVTFAQLASAQDKWTLETGDFATKTVTLNRFESDKILFTANEVESSVALSDFLLLERKSPPTRPKAKWQILLANGDVLQGEPTALVNEKLEWKSELLGPISIPSSQLRGLFAGKLTALPTVPTRTEDVVLLANGDRLSGLISQMNSTGVSVTVGGSEVKAPLDSVTSIQFADIGGAGQSKGATFRVVLSDGSRLTVSDLVSEGSALAFTLPGTVRKQIDVASIVSLEQLNGPVTWLSTRTPIENVQTPWFDSKWPATFDRALNGEPIRFRDRTFSHGIAVHSYSRLTFKLSPEDKAFRTQYAIAGDRSLADVTVRIKTGEKVLHEAKNVRAGKLADPVILDLAGAESLTLEVDYGDGYDVQDQLLWIEPALLKQMPAK